MREKVIEWLDAFAKCVREEDFETGRQMFSPQVKSFGTVAEEVVGLDNLIERQWKKIWPNTEGFRFDTQTAAVFGDDDSKVFGVAVEWSSRGLGVNGEKFDRQGRCTIMLDRQGDELLATHSHFSAPPKPNFPERF